MLKSNRVDLCINTTSTQISIVSNLTTGQSCGSYLSWSMKFCRDWFPRLLRCMIIDGIGYHGCHASSHCKDWLPLLSRNNNLLHKGPQGSDHTRHLYLCISASYNHKSMFNGQQQNQQVYQVSFAFARRISKLISLTSTWLSRMCVLLPQHISRFQVSWHGGVSLSARHGTTLAHFRIDTWYACVPTNTHDLLLARFGTDLFNFFGSNKLL